jgi:hypothetical protein
MGMRFGLRRSPTPALTDVKTWRKLTWALHKEDFEIRKINTGKIQFLT